MLRRLSLQTTAHRVLALTTIPLLSLSSTYLTYGAVAEQKKRKARMGRSSSLAASAAPEAAASRSAYRAKSAGIGGLGKRDLIADSASGTVRLDPSRKSLFVCHEAILVWGPAARGGAWAKKG